MNDDKNGATFRVSWIKSPFKKALLWIGIGAVAVGFFFLIIIVNVVSDPLEFLDFGNMIKKIINKGEDDDIEQYTAEYESYYGEICKEGDADCPDVTAKDTKKKLKQQKNYFKKLNSLSSDERLTNKQQNMLLATSYYGYNITEFNEEDGAFEEINFKNEKKHLKHLIKLFGDPKSDDNYYKGLLEDDYLDEKPIANNLYEEYGRLHNLDEDISNWEDKDRQAVRATMVDDIKKIVEDFNMMQSNSTALSRCSTGEYWLPIGSSETTTEGDKVFASGDPITVTITTHAFVIDSSHPKPHGGIDLGNNPSTIGIDNVIASIDGTVVAANDSCPSTASNCGGGFGNYVYIQDGKGNVEIYGHMSSGSVTVNEGESVMQGQVLGKIGSSGHSTGPHLHFEMHDPSGNKLDPEEFVSIENPRPGGNSGGSGTCSGAITGDSNMQSVCLSFKNAGYPDEGIAALLINLTSEAHYDTECINGYGSGAAGMAQWYQGRFDTLQNTYGEDWIKLENQIEYLMMELDTEVKPGSKNILMNASDVGSTAEHFCNVFEVPGEEYCSPRNNSSMSAKYLDFVKNDCQGNVVRTGPDTGDCVRRHGEFQEDLQ